MFLPLHNAGLFAIILIKGHKVDFLCLKKCAYCENQFISCVFQLILVKLSIVLFCFYNNTSRFSLGVITAEVN